MTEPNETNEDTLPMTHTRRRPKWSLLITIGVFFLVIAGVLWIVFTAGSGPSPDDPIVEEYGPWRFEWQPPFWVTGYRREGQEYEIKFRYLPSEVDNITVNGSNASLSAPYYVSFDPDMSNVSKTHTALAFADTGAKLKGIYGATPFGACTTNVTDPACGDRAAITCESNVSAIVFTEAVEPSVTLSANCIEIRGTGPDLYRAETLMWYRLLGIVR